MRLGLTEQEDEGNTQTWNQQQGRELQTETVLVTFVECREEFQVKGSILSLIVFLMISQTE